MKRVVILTGHELRHQYFKTYLASIPQIQIVQSYCEDHAPLTKLVTMTPSTPLQKEHLAARITSEKEFFQEFVSKTQDRSNPKYIVSGTINSPAYVQEIIGLNPDLIICYGCSIIKAPLIEAFPRRIMNIHLGLSPYYRGAGTNYWPLVNAEPEYVGVSFIYLDEGIDTGEVIHQIRARIFEGDSPHQIGNRLIGDMCVVAAKLIEKFERLSKVQQLRANETDRYYRTRDFSPESVERLIKNFNSSLVKNYLREEKVRTELVPIIKNPAIE